MTPCKDLSKVDLLYVLSSLDTEKVEKMVNFCERQNLFFFFKSSTFFQMVDFGRKFELHLPT